MLKTSFRVLAVTCAVVGLPYVAVAAPTINRAPDLVKDLEGLKGVAVLPIASCPAALDCPEVERLLYIAAHRRLPGLIPAEVVRQRAFALGLDLADGGAREQLAASFAVDAFLAPSVPHLVMVPLRDAFIPGDAPEARVELKLVSVSGRPFFQGTDQRRGGTIHTAPGHVGKLLKGILDQALPRR